MDEVDLQSEDNAQSFLGIRLGKNLSVFLICLTLTTVFWLLNAFTKDYSTQLYYPIKYDNLPEEEVVVNELPKFLAVDVNGFGFKLLSFYLFGSLDSIAVDYNSGLKKYRSEGSLSIIPKSKLKHLINGEIPSDIKIQGLSIDSLRIFTDPIKDKIVAIKPAVNYFLEEQYYLKDSIKVSPKSVLISGPSSLLSELDTISTQKITLSDLDKTMSLDVELSLPDKFTCLTKKVRLTIKVDRATEKSLKVPIRIKKDTVAKRVKVFPETTEVIVKVGLTDFDKLQPNQFQFEVDPKSSDLTKKFLNVRLVKKPNNVEIISFSPRRVEYILIQ